MGEHFSKISACPPPCGGQQVLPSSQAVGCLHALSPLCLSSFCLFASVQSCCAFFFSWVRGPSRAQTSTSLLSHLCLLFLPQVYEEGHGVARLPGLGQSCPHCCILSAGSCLVTFPAASGHTQVPTAKGVSPRQALPPASPFPSRASPWAKQVFSGQQRGLAHCCATSARVERVCSGGELPLRSIND